MAADTLTTGPTKRAARAGWWLLWLAAPLIIALRMNFDGPIADWLARKDFVNLWVAGRLAWSGDIQAIFDPASFQQASSALLGRTYTTNNYSYPPHALFVALPFALLPYAGAYLAWTVAGAAFFTWAVRRTCPPRFPWLLAALTPAGLINILWGHYGFLYGGLWLLAFQPSTRAGLAAAALTFKPHLGLLVVPAMLQDRRRLAIAVLGTLLLALASWLAFGAGAWRAFFTDTFAFQAGLIEPARRDALMFLQVSPVISYGWLGWLYCALIGGWMAARRFNVWTAATATFLLAPYAFHYDMTVASLGFALVLMEGRSMPIWQRVVCVLGFLSPAIVLFGNFLAPPILLIGLWVQTRRLEGTDLLAPLLPRRAGAPAAAEQ